MRMLNNSELEFVSGGLVQNPDGSINGSFGPLAKYIYQLTGASTSGVTGASTSGGDALDTVDVTAKRDYCGSGFTSGVPDDPLGYDFSDACKLHDMLYSVLTGPHGKAISDAMFLRMMLDWCEQNAPGDQSCRNMAYAYAAGGALFGGPAYVFARPGR